MTNDLRIVALISGRGSNLQSLISHRESFEIIEVLSNTSSPPGFAFAAEATIPTWSPSKSDFPTLPERKQAIYKRIKELQPDLIVLAGFMVILDTEFVDHYSGRILNIHPSLLPDFPGLDTHKRALERFHEDQSQCLHGCTVHYVDSGIDTGAVIAQATCQILPHDDELSLSERVLAKEHELYPCVVSAVARGEISLSHGKASHSKQFQTLCLDRGYSLPQESSL